MKTQRQRLTEAELQETMHAFCELIPRLLSAMMMTELATGGVGRKWSACKFLESIDEQNHPKAALVSPYLHLAFHGTRTVTIQQMEKRLRVAVDIASMR